MLEDSDWNVFSEQSQSERKDQVLINNRQAGRRNRGRNNNGRPNGGNRGGGDSGNRIDNRARGNAAQLLEKYKNMARDAQMSGDRVNAEYYLQFADHYFRVLADNRARQEEQQQRFRRHDEQYEDEGEEFDASDEGGEESRSDFQPERSYEGDRRRDNQRDYRDNRNQREPRRRDRSFAEESAAPAPMEYEAPQPVAREPVAEARLEEEAPRPRRGRPRKMEAVQPAAEQGLDLAALPPSIARNDEEGEEAAEAPRKRTRRPRPAAQAAE